MLHKGWVCLLAALALAASAPVFSAEAPRPEGLSVLQQLAVVALAPAEKRAVVRLADGRLALLRPGDAVAGTAATVRQVLSDRLVLEERTAESSRTVWVHRAAGPDGRSRVQILDPRQPDVPVETVPVVVDIPSPSTSIPSNRPPNR